LRYLGFCARYLGWRNSLTLSISHKLSNSKGHKTMSGKRRARVKGKTRVFLMLRSARAKSRACAFVQKISYLTFLFSPSLFCCYFLACFSLCFFLFSSLSFLVNGLSFFILSHISIWNYGEQRINSFENA
jgi:hypothetical protein